MYVKNSIQRVAKILVILLFVFSASYGYGATPAGYSEYYIPGDEDTMGIVLCAEGATACPAGYHMHTVISVTASSDNTTVYYDHWENGYNFDPANPSTADETITLNTGQVHAFETANIALPTTSRGTCSPAGTCPYDGRDRLYVAGGVVTVTRVGWVEERGVGLQGVAWEIYPVRPQLTTYVVPFGETSGWYGFQRLNILIQATEDNTTVTVDLNHDGTPDQLDTNRDGTLDASSVALQAGESFLLDDLSAHVTAGTLAAGAVITGTETLQVKYIAGRTDINNCTRGFSAFPRGFWTKDYYAPLNQPGTDINGQAGDTDYYLYNPNSAPITINWESSTNTGSFSIPATSTVSFRTASGVSVPTTSGLYLKGSDIFWGVGSNDANHYAGTSGYAHEWGYSLLPTTMLYNEHFLGWAPDGLAVAAGRTQMGVFLIAAQDNTHIFVDYDNNGTADQTYTLDRLQSQYITDPDGDMSGTRIWATGPFSMAYGQNSANSDNSSPALDLGYIAIPGGDFVSLVLGVHKSVSPQVVSTASGSQAAFTIKVNSQKYTVDGVAVTDYLPAGWQYVNNSTTITRPDQTQITSSAANPTITGSGPYTLSWTSAQVGGNMLENQEITITFTGQTTQNFTTGDISQNNVKAVGTRTVGGVTQTFNTTDFVFNTYSNNTVSMQVTKSSSVAAATPVNPGDTITYTVTATNPASSTVPLTGVSIYDPLPAGVSYVSGSGSVTCEYPRNVRDEFTTVAYNNTNGSVSWSSNPWTETNDAQDQTTGDAAGGIVRITGGVLQMSNYRTVADNFGTQVYTRNDGTTDWAGAWTESDSNGAAQSATAGYIQVTGGRLQINNTGGVTTQSVTRGINLTGTGATTATLTFDYTTSGNLENADQIYVQYRRGGSGLWTSFPAANPFQNDVNGTANFNIPLASPANLTEIRFAITSNTAYTSADEFFYVDNLVITYNANPPAIQRTANLAGATSATLSFTLTNANIEAGDTFVVEASSNGGASWGVLDNFTSATGTGAKSYNLKSPIDYTSANTVIRFRITGGFDQPNETFSVNNVDISYALSGTFTSQDPPDFLSKATGCRIQPGNSLTLTYNVTVDNPLATGIDEITNTAYINCNEIILPLSASVTNIVVNPSSGSATVGDRVWFDINGDGILDVGEPGLANVEVTLKDQYGTPVMTTTTDATGHYLFTGVTPGNGYYVEETDGLPSGLQQSAPSGRSDNRTAAFNLTDSQSYAGADLGYRSASGYAAVGNLVWSDANSNSTRDPGEAGIGGVTVQLCFDTDGDGIWDTNEQTGPGCRTATTAPDGSYLFTGVPAGNPVGTEDYFVYVDGAQASLAGYTRTTPANDPLYVNNLSAGDVIQYADFGYHGTTYSITDRVWFDADGDGSPDVGETGIALVTVDLLDTSLNAIATTTTDANGYFTFSGVKGGGADYTVRITDTNSKLTDYFGTTSSATTRSLQIPNLSGNVDNTSSPHFGYNLRGAIGDTVFYDTNGNGSQDTGEPGSSGITVKLYSDSGTIGIIDGSDAVVATVTTDANGRYLFSGRANGNYIVSIESPPSGYTYTGADSDTVTTGQQQSASIVSNGNVLNKDFGYQVPPVSARSVSGRIWNDTNNDGSDVSESGIAGVTIDLLLGSNVIATTSSASDGNYSFTGLPSNTYTVKITDNAGVLSGYVATYERTELTVSPFNGQEAVVLTSGNLTGVNFGYVSPVIPTLAVLSSFGASVTDGQVVVEWETASEHNTLGFYLLRLDAATGAYRSIADGLLPGLITDPKGGSYSLIDRGAFPGETYRYKLVEVERDGKQIIYGPFSVSVGTGNVAGSQSVRTNSVQASGTGSGSGISDYSRKPRQNSAFKKSLLQMRSVSETTAVTQQQTQTYPVKGSRIRIPVSENGLYYMDANDISAITGVNYSLIKYWIGTKFLSMSNQGRPVAYLPAGNNAGLFFYGTGTDSVYTRNNIYWIDMGKGLTMNNETGPVPAPPAPDDAFSDSLHIEKDVFPNMGQTTNPAEDYWDWGMIYLSHAYSDGPKSFKFLLNGKADTQNEASLQVHLVGGSDSGISNDHHVVIKLNGQQIGKDEGELWGGLNPYSFTAAFNQSLLKEGENTIEVQGLLDEGIPFSMFLIDSFDLTYERLYEADGNKLFFKGDGNRSVRVKGFTSTTPDILLFNVTNPETPSLNTSAITDGSTGDYGISFKPVSPDARYLAVARDAAVKVVNAQGANPSSLRSASNRVDYLIIAPYELASAVKPLSDYRSLKGLQSKVVTVDDIMNEFNYGLSSPEAIKQFLSYAYKYWSRKPKYVLLAGGGTWDYRDNKGEGGNLIPPAMVPTAYGLSTSDNYLADINGDHVPEMAIGRLPVLTPQDMQNVITKIKAFEAASGRRVILVADNSDEGGHFSTDSENIAGLFPSTYILEKVYLDEYPSTELARMTLFNYINAGSVFFNYIGHASFDMFTAEGLFTSDDIAPLPNGTGLPVVTAMTCTAGEFAIPGYPSISQLMVLQNGGGAAAFWSATGLSDNTEAKILNWEFYNAVFNGNKKVLGDAVLQALGKYKTSGSMPFMMDIYTILGDPALKLR